MQASRRDYIFRNVENYLVLNTGSASGYSFVRPYTGEVRGARTKIKSMILKFSG